MRRRFAAGALLAVSFLGCATPKPRRDVAAVENEGELFVYLMPLPDEARRLVVTLESAAVPASEGPSVPLTLDLAVVSSEVTGQRLLAHGRVAPGRYDGLEFVVKAAGLRGEDGVSALSTVHDPQRVSAPFPVTRGRATVVWLTLKYLESADRSFSFALSAAGAVPPSPVAQLAGYCTRPQDHVAMLFDKRARVVSAALATGREPIGVAIDVPDGRAYLAIRQEDALDVVDLASSEPIKRVQLRPGDRPRDVAVAISGRLVLVVNEGSDSLSFVDPSSSAEVSRVSAGLEPWSILVDRSGQRAFVFARRSRTIEVIDLATRAVVRSVAAEAEPLRGALDRAGSRLYVLHRGSAHVSVYALPSLSLERRLFVGLGAQFVLVDARTDLLYVAGNEPRVQVFEPSTFMALTSLATAAPVGYMAIDDLENVMFLALPARGAIEAIDLTSRRTIAIIEVGAAPGVLALAGERH